MKYQQTLHDREPVVSGRFYAKTRKELEQELADLFSKAEKLTAFRVPENQTIKAIICPHAGYLFSGVVAASAYRFLRQRTEIRRVLLIGSSHHVLFRGASVYYEGHYKTPMGRTPVDQTVAHQLLQKSELFQYNRQAHELEHTLEVQLPFLQTVLKEGFTIVPIVLGSVDDTLAEQLAESLQSFFFDRETLVVISTDLSHYPNYNDAVKLDALTIEALCTNDARRFLHQLRDNEQKDYPNLSTSMCGWTSVLTLLHLTQGRANLHYHPILYQNSGDIPVYGDKHRVVGYQSVVITQEDEAATVPFSLSEQEQHLLLDMARQSIIGSLNGESRNVEEQYNLPNLQRKLGAFVSVYVHEELRGCIGRIETQSALQSTIRDMAVSAACHDSRFAPIRTEELNDLKIEISVLSPLHKIDDISEIDPKQHGILIRKGLHSGTFLPQVGRRTGWCTEELLSRCAEGKAGLGRNGWRDADIFIYEALVFKED